MKYSSQLIFVTIGSILAYLPICGEGGCRIADPSAPLVFNANPGDVFVTISDTIQLGATLYMEYISASQTTPQCGYEMTGSGVSIDSSVIPERTGTTNNGNGEWTISKELSGLKNGLYYTIRGYIWINGKKSYSDPVRDHSHFTATIQPTEWVRLADLPSDNGIISGSCIVSGGSCFGFGDIYYASTNSWYTPKYKFLNPDPGNTRFPAVAGPIFQMNGSLYRYSQSRRYYNSIGGPYSQIYFDVLESMDTSTLQFSQYPNDTLKGRTSMIIFSIGSILYAGGGDDEPTLFSSGDIMFYSDFWKFDPVVKRWIRLTDLPMSLHKASFSAAAGSKGYVALIDADSTRRPYGPSEFWEYDPLLDSWTKKTPPPMDLSVTWSCCSDGKQVFAFSPGLFDAVYNKLLPNTNGLWQYTPAAGSWKELDNGTMSDGTLGNDGSLLYLLGSSRNINGAHRLWKYAP